MMTVLCRRIAACLIACGMCSCNGDLMMSAMTSYCDVSDDDYWPDPHNDGDPSPPIDCKFTKGQAFGSVCRHAGANWKHNWASDQWGNQLYPSTGPHTMGISDDYGYGCDAVFKTGGEVSFDGYIKTGAAKPTVFEMKTSTYDIHFSDSCPDAVKAQILGRVEKDYQDSAAKQEPVAMACDYRYQMVFTDHTLYSKANDYFANDSFIDTELCDGCRSPPSKPTDYDVKPTAVPVEGGGFTRFWLDDDGILQSVHMTKDIP